MFSLVDEIGNNSYIICGDYNLVLDPSLDYDNYKRINNGKARLKLLNHIQNRQLFDPFREIFPDQQRYTWRRKNPLQQAS